MKYHAEYASYDQGQLTSCKLTWLNWTRSKIIHTRTCSSSAALSFNPIVYYGIPLQAESTYSTPRHLTCMRSLMFDFLALVASKRLANRAGHSRPFSEVFDLQDDAQVEVEEPQQCICWQPRCRVWVERGSTASIAISLYKAGAGRGYLLSDTRSTAGRWCPCIDFRLDKIGWWIPSLWWGVCDDRPSGGG